MYTIESGKKIADQNLLLRQGKITKVTEASSLNALVHLSTFTWILHKSLHRKKIFTFPVPIPVIKKTVSNETVFCVLFFKLLIASLYKICQVFSFQ